MTQPEDIIEVGRRLGVIKRQRNVDLSAMVAATIGAVSPVPGSETSALVNYLQLVGGSADDAKIALSSFCDRYSDELAALMRELALRAVAWVCAAVPDEIAIVDLGSLFMWFEDVRLVDSTCHILKRVAPAGRLSTTKSSDKPTCMIGRPPIEGKVGGGGALYQLAARGSRLAAVRLAARGSRR